jgi:hypothetical protein
MLPKTGHGINLEEPAAFNAILEDFIHNVERGRWGPSPVWLERAIRWSRATSEGWRSGWPRPPDARQCHFEGNEVIVTFSGRTCFSRSV